MGSVTTTGYVADRLDDIFSGLVTKFKGIYGDDILTDPDDPDGQMIGIFAQMRADVENVIELVYQANDPDNATGAWLEQKVAFAGLSRRGASYSIIDDVSLTGTAGTVIPAGATVSGGGTQWVTQSDTTLGSDGSAKTDFRSSDVGQFSVDVGTALDIVTLIAGWNTATTTVAASPGENEETDPELLERFYKSRARTSSNCVDGTIADIAGLAGVTDVTAIENNADKTDVNNIPAYSVNYVVEGGDRDEIAKAIYNNWPGSGLWGIEEVVVLRRSGKTVPIFFSRPLAVDITAVIKIGRRENFTHIDEETVKAAITTLAPKIGEPVYQSDVSAAVGAVAGVFVHEVLLSRDGKTPADVPSIAVDALEKARFLATGITVQVVEDSEV